MTFELGFLVTVLAASSVAAPTERFALIIGNNSALEASQSPLRFADDDAARFFELLSPGSREAYLLTVFDKDSQEVFEALVPQASPPTGAKIRAVATQIRNQIAQSKALGHKTELYIFYAGHGDVEDGEGYIALMDGRLTRTELRDLLLNNSGADRTHVIVDACKSYFMVTGRGPGGEREVVSPGFVTPDVTVNVGYILSSSSDAESHEWRAISGGIFSHEVRSALVGAADANLDGAVDYEELAAFVAVANESIPQPHFRPGVYVRPPANDRRAQIFKPASLPDTTRLRMDAESDGRLSLNDARGFRYMDVNKAHGDVLDLFLLGNRRYDLQFEDSTLAINAAGEPLHLSALLDSARPVQIAARNELHRAFEHLFEAPFGRSVVRGFRLARDDLKLDAKVGKKERETRRGWQVGLMGGGAAAVAAGVVLGVLALDARGAADSAAQADRPGLENRYQAFGVSGLALGTLGLSALGTGLYLALSESP